MAAEDENSLITGVLADELAGMPEVERVRMQRILQLVFTTIAGLDQRVRELEEQRRLKASDI
jgi:hypothetical protein